jgi:Ni,Fe-hydrogenase I large subunit
VFPVIYLLVGYLLASCVSSFKRNYTKYQNYKLTLPEWEKQCEALDKDIQALENYGAMMHEPVPDKDQFQRLVKINYKRAMKKFISLVDDVISAKENWKQHIDIVVEGDSMQSRMAEYISQIKTQEELKNMKRVAEASLATF